MKKHYLRKNEDASLTYIGAHGVRPRNTYVTCPTDENGKFVTDVSIIKIVDVEETMESPVYKVDEDGELLLDENGAFIQDTDEDGNLLTKEVITSIYKKAIVDEDLKAEKEVLLAQKEIDDKWEFN